MNSPTFNSVSIENWLKKWEEKECLWSKWEKERWLKTFELISKIKKNVVLDVGCRYGYFAEVFASNGNTVHGIDIEDHSKDFEGIGTFYQHNLEQGLPKFPKGYFDVVHANGVLEHIANLDNLLEDIYEALKQGGLAIFSVPTEKLNLAGKLFHKLIFLEKLLNLRFKLLCPIVNLVRKWELVYKFLRPLRVIIPTKGTDFEAYIGASSYWQSEHIWKKPKGWWEEKFKQHGFKIIEISQDKPRISYFWRLSK